MEALLARELAIAATSEATAAKKKKVKVGGAVAQPRGAAAVAPKKEKAKRVAVASPGVANADVVESGDEEEDDDLHENGYMVPDALAHPASDADAAADVGRRVYLEGVAGRDALAGILIGWRRGRGEWEVELDRHDERILVRPANLRWLDQPAPASRKKPKLKSKPSDGAGSSTSSKGATSQRSGSETSKAGASGKKKRKERK